MFEGVLVSVGVDVDGDEGAETDVSTLATVVTPTAGRLVGRGTGGPSARAPLPRLISSPRSKTAQAGHWVDAPCRISSRLLERRSEKIAACEIRSQEQNSLAVSIRATLETVQTFALAWVAPTSNRPAVIALETCKKRVLVNMAETSNNAPNH